MRSSIVHKILGAGAAVAALAIAAASPAFAQQNWPTRQMTFIVPYPAGTGADFLGRVLGEYVGKKLGQTVIVENRAGAGATIGTAAFSRSAPDGYTFLVTGPSPIVNAPLLYKQLSYDATKFVPISMVMESPIMVVVHNDVPAKNLKELVEYARANPGKLNFGETGAGSTHQLLDLIFKSAAKTDINLVSYKTVYPMMDLIAGRIDVMLDYPGMYTQHVKEGKLRILANLNTTRHKTYADVPTMAEAGLPEYPGWLGWFAVFAPQGTPPDIIKKMNEAITEYLKTPEATERFSTQNFIPWPSTPEEVTKKMEHESAILSKVIKDNNISLD
jgi:tripartite-type tricarboxylate transporter receptor subunit TctC